MPPVEISILDPPIDTIIVKTIRDINDYNDTYYIIPTDTDHVGTTTTSGKRKSCSEFVTDIIFF